MYGGSKCQSRGNLNDGHAVSLLQGATGRSVGTSGWDGLVWRLKYLNAMLCLSSRGQLVDL